MNIPYVIDKIETCLADVLNHLLESHPGAELEIATAYFSIRGAGGLATVTRQQQARLLLARWVNVCFSGSADVRIARV